MIQGTSMEPREQADFVFSETLYIACLETLLSGYIVPLSNTIRLRLPSGSSSPTPPREPNELLHTFGSDVLEVLSCHRALINALQINDHDTVDNTNCDDAVGERHEDPMCRVLSALAMAVPAMRVAYQRYVSNFYTNVEQVHAQRASLPINVWESVYMGLSRATLTNRLLELDVDEREVTSLVESGNISFEALASLPIRHISRYPLLIEDWIEAQREAAAEKARLQSAQETLMAMRAICIAANRSRAAVFQAQKLGEVEKTLGVLPGPSRFISEGDVAVKSGSETTMQGCRRRGHLILLSDCFILALFAKNGTREAKRVERIPLSNVLSVLSTRTVTEFGVEISYEPLRSWRQWARNERVQRLIVFVSNESEMLLWVRDFTQAISDLVAPAG